MRFNFRPTPIQRAVARLMLERSTSRQASTIPRLPEPSTSCYAAWNEPRAPIDRATLQPTIDRISRREPYSWVVLRDALAYPGRHRRVQSLESDPPTGHTKSLISYEI